MDEFYSIEVLAKKWGISVRTIYNRLSAKDPFFPQPLHLPSSRRLYWNRELINTLLRVHSQRSEQTIVIQKFDNGWRGCWMRGGEKHQTPLCASPERALEELKNVTGN